MKRSKLLFVMLTSFSVVSLFTSCKGNGDDPQPPINEEVKEVTIGITGNNGEVITVQGTDVTKDVMIRSTEKVDRDIEVSLAVDAVDGNATLSATKATIAKGTDVAL